MSVPGITIPIPEVLIKIWSPLPRSTTFVSPVTSETPAAAAASRIDSSTRRKSCIENPSSIINPAERYPGRAPHIARSLTVPWTASLPISPPGKKIGFTTYESVLKASFALFKENTAPSCNDSSNGFRNAGRIMRSINRCVILPPLPCARTISLCSEIGSGHVPFSGEASAAAAEDSWKRSNDIVFSQRNMDQVPRDVHERGMDFLNPVNAIGRHNERIIGEFREPPAVFSNPRDREQLPFAGGFHRINQVRRFSARAHRQRHVSRLREQFELVHEHARIILVVADGRHRADIRHQWNHRKRLALFNDRMRELNAKMQRVTQTAAIAHDEQFFSRCKTFRHVPRHGLNLSGIFGEKFLLHLDTLAAFAKDLVAIRLRAFLNNRVHRAITSASWVRGRQPCKWRP